MKALLKLACISAGAFALNASVASAAVVCNEDGDCWRTTRTYEYKPELRLRVHPDNWRWQESESTRYRWREAPSETRGYWRGERWIEIED